MTHSQIKKNRKVFESRKRKTEKQADGAKTAAGEQKPADDGKKVVVLVEDAALAKAVPIKIREGVAHRGQRVQIHGWVHRVRAQSKKLMFVVLRDGTGLLQCVLTGKLVRQSVRLIRHLQCECPEAVALQTESTLVAHGKLVAVPGGQDVSWT